MNFRLFQIVNFICEALKIHILSHAHFKYLKAALFLIPARDGQQQQQRKGRENLNHQTISSSKETPHLSLELIQYLAEHWNLM